MRTFEIWLLAVNALTLAAAFRQPPGKVHLWTAGINILLVLLHGLFEGFRYQMIFSYIFVAAVAAYSLLRSRIKLPGAIKAVAAIGCALLLACTALLAYALPVFAIPEPKGSHAVGVKYFHLVDENRADPFLERSDAKRELMIKVFYPAQPDDSVPYKHYFNDSPELIRAFTGFYQMMPAFTFDHLKLVRTHAKENLPVSTERRRYPVVLYSHGAGASMEVHTSACEDLASQGYVVVAIDHPYVTAATEFPVRIVRSEDATADFKVPEPAGIITDIMTDDARFVLDTLEELNGGRMDAAFAAKLDLDRIGAAGHSVGGAVAYNLAISDPRVKAAMNVDGFVYRTPDGDAQTMSPVLMLANDKYHIQLFRERRADMKKLEDLPELDRTIMLDIYGSEAAYNAEYEKAGRSLNGIADEVKASGYLYTIEGSDHMKFTDIGLFFGSRKLRELFKIEGSASPARCLEITNALTAAFFDRHLKDGTGDGLERLISSYPELKKIAVP